MNQLHGAANKRILRHSVAKTIESRSARHNRWSYDLEVGVGNFECLRPQDHMSSGTIATHNFPSTIVVMTYRRQKRFENLIHQLQDLLPDHVEKQTHLIVAQSVDTSITNFSAAHEDIIHRFARGTVRSNADLTKSNRARHNWVGTIEHIKTPLLLNDTSFSNNLKQFGNKRNSVRNLIAGLRQARDRMQEPPVGTLLVIEDDAVLSCDALQFVSRVTSKMEANPLISVGSLDFVTRPSLIVGNMDTEWAYHSARADPTSTITVAANQRTVVKTFAWVLRNEYALKYLALLDSVESDPKGGLGSVMSGCLFCEAYCYDHVAEWSLYKYGNQVMYPGVARVRQTKGKGMTYAENPVNAIYIGAPVRIDDFQDQTTSIAAGIVSMFSVPGASAWMQPKDPSISRLIYAVASGEPFIRFTGATICLLLVTCAVICGMCFRRKTDKKIPAHLE